MKARLLAMFALTASALAAWSQVLDPFALKHEPILMLSRGEYQKELKLDKAQSAELKKIIKEYEDRLKGIGATPPNPNDLAAGLEAMKSLNKGNAESSARALAILNPEQVERYLGLRYQTIGGKALAEPEYAKRLEFSEDQMAKITDLKEKDAQGFMAVYMEAARAPQGIAKKLKEYQKGVHEGFLAILNPSQLAKLKAIEGKAFGPAMKERGF